MSQQEKNLLLDYPAVDNQYWRSAWLTSSTKSLSAMQEVTIEIMLKGKHSQ